MSLFISLEAPARPHQARVGRTGGRCCAVAREPAEFLWLTGVTPPAGAARALL